MTSIIGVLAATRSSESSQRINADNHIASFINDIPQKFLAQLLEVASNPESNIADAQSALLVLKSCVTKYWGPGFEQFVGTPFSHEVRDQIRVGLLRLLAIAPNHKVRVLCASIISKIGNLEYPEQWPDLIQRCVELLSDSSNSTSMLGGLVLFKELLLDTLREEDFMSFGEHVLSMLYQIAEPITHDGRRLLALQCFHECITFLLMGDDDQMPHLQEIADRFIPQWCGLFCQILQEAQILDDVEVVKAIAGAISEIDSAFGKSLEPLLPQIFNVIVGVLTYEEHATCKNEIKAVLSSLLMIALQTNTSQAKCLDTNAKISQFANLLLSLAKIPKDIAHWWAENFNAFTTFDLELDCGEYDSRINAAALVGSVNKPFILTYLLDLLASTKDNPSLHEAVLFLLSSLLSQIDIDKLLVPGDMKKIQLLLEAPNFNEFDGSSEDPEPEILLLVSRKILLASAICKYGGTYLSKDTKLYMAKLVFKSPFSNSEIVRMSQLRASITGATLFPDEFRPYQGDLLKLTASLIEDAEDDSPVVLTECFGSVLKLDYNIVVQNSDSIDMIFALAGKDTSDVDLNAQILDVVGEILDAISTREVVSRILQPIMTILSTSANNGYEFSGDLYFAMDLATALFAHEGLDISGLEREQILQSFYDVITRTEDTQILQAASFAYAALVQNIQAQISPETAQNVLRVAAQLLNPCLTDSAALASGKLVTAIIEKFSDEFGEVILKELIEACAKRLCSAKNALLVETLAMVFCELVLRNARAVIDLLSASSMLDPVMMQWIPAFEVVRGVEEIHKNVRALQILFDLHDPRLVATMLPDEPIKKANEILTRSRAANLQFVYVPLPLKILKLLIRELSQAPKPSSQAEMNQGCHSQHPLNANPIQIDSDATDDDWDDELALNEEGELIDFRLYNLILDWIKGLVEQPASLEWLKQLNDNETTFLTNLFNGA